MRWLRIRKASRSRVDRSAQCSVLDHQDHGTAFGQALQDQEHLLEQPGPCLARLVRPGRGAEFRQQPGQLRAAAAGQQAGHAGRAEIAHELAEHGGERGERQAVRAELEAAAESAPAPRCRVTARQTP